MYFHMQVDGRHLVLRLLSKSQYLVLGLVTPDHIFIYLKLYMLYLYLHFVSVPYPRALDIHVIYLKPNAFSRGPLNITTRIKLVT